MNRGQLRLRVTQYTSADNTASGEEETLINSLLNEAIIDILSRTRLTMHCLDITIPANADLVDIPDAVLRMHGLYDTEGTPWVKKAPDMIDDLGEYAVIGVDLLKVLPTDADRLFSTFYVRLPTAMSNDAHDPSDETYGGIPAQFHPVICNYACWKFETMTENPVSGRGEGFRVLYEGKEGSSGVAGGDIARIRRFVNTHIQPSGRRRPPADSYVGTSYL